MVDYSLPTACRGGLFQQHPPDHAGSRDVAGAAAWAFEACIAVIRDLAASMCRAQGPAMALAEAAKACSSSVPAVVFVGLAMLTRDKQSLRYAVLLTRQRAAEQLGPVTPSSAAAGITILTKQPVNARDLNTGDLGLQDLQYLRHMHGAQSFYAAPLVVSQSAQAALCVASAEPNASAGREDFLQVIAAMSAPYLTLLTSTLPALEGLVKQVLPVRVALQLRESAAQQQQQAQLPTAVTSQGNSSSNSITAAGPHAQDASSRGGAGSFAAATAAAGPQQQQLQEDGSAGAASGGRPWAPQPRRWQQQRQLRSRNPLLQQQLQQQQQQAQLSREAMPQRMLSPDQQQHHQPQQHTALESGTALGPLLRFKQPQLELAYRICACRQWQQWLDMLFLLLSLLSAVGGRFGSISSALGSPAVALLLLLVVGIVLWVLVQQLLALPVPTYIKVRAPSIVAVRLLCVLLFCFEAHQLPLQVFKRPSAAFVSGAADAASVGSWVLQLQQLLCWTPAEVAGCGIVIMQGLSGQLPLPLHATVQAASVAALLGSLVLSAVDKTGAAAVVPVCVVMVQVLVTWLVPVLVVALVEWRMREAFVRRIC